MTTTTTPGLAEASADDPPRLGPVLRLVGAGMFLDTMLFGILTPLLPHYVDDLSLTKGAAGVLAGACGAGAVAGALPSGALASRLGGKRVVVLGLVAMAAASAAFALAGALVPMVVARFLQGAAGVAVWAGGLSWASGLVPANRRGALVGSLLGIGVTGMIVGPLAGGLAVATSPAVVFGAVPVLALAVAAAMLRAPAPSPVERRAGSLAELWRRPAPRATAAINMWFMLLAAAAIGLTSALGPLRLDALGAAGGTIALIYLLAGCAEAAMSPVAGRLADARGGAAVLGGATLALGVTLTLFVLPHAVVPLAATIVAVSACLGCFGAPVGLALSVAVGRAGLGEAHAYGLFNLMFAGGNVIGAAGGSLLADAGGDALPALTLAALAATTVPLARRV